MEAITGLLVSVGGVLLGIATLALPILGVIGLLNRYVF